MIVHYFINWKIVASNVVCGSCSDIKGNILALLLCMYIIKLSFYQRQIATIGPNPDKNTTIRYRERIFNTPLG